MFNFSFLEFVGEMKILAISFSRPFVVQRVAHSNLVLVVVDSLCVNDLWAQEKIVKMEIDNNWAVSCMNALNANLTRKRPKVCVGKAGGERVSKEMHQVFQVLCSTVAESLP